MRKGGNHKDRVSATFGTVSAARGLLWGGRKDRPESLEFALKANQHSFSRKLY